MSRRAIALWALALVAAYVAPRVVAYRGLEQSPRIEFLDMNRHQVNVDLIEKAGRLGPGSFDHPHLDHHRTLPLPVHPMKWPHGVYHLAGLWSGALGPMSIWTTQLTNGLFAALLVLALAGLGRHALGSTRLGLWAALLVLLSPWHFAAGWYLSLDLPLASMVAMGLLLLLGSDRFRRPGYTAAFGLWSGLAVAVKLTYGLYLLGPSVVALVLGLRPGGWRARARVAGQAALAALVALGLGAYLVGVDLAEVWTEASAHFGTGDPNEHFEMHVIQPWTLRWVMALPLFAANNFPWPLLLLLLPGLGLAHHPRRALPGRWLLLSFLWGAYLVLTLMGHKLERYLLPVYPALCLVGVWGLARIGSGRAARFALPAVGAAFAAALLAAHFYPTPWFVDERSRGPEDYMYELRLPGVSTLAGLRRYKHHHQCDLRQLMKQAEALERSDPSNQPLMVAMVWADDAPGADLVRVRNLFWYLRTHMAHAARDRLVMEPTERPFDPLREAVLHAPLILVLHPPEVDPEQLYPGTLELRQRRQARLTCQGEPPATAALSLYKSTFRR